MEDYSVTLNTATVQELADIINNKNNTMHYRDEAFKVLQNNAQKEYTNWKLGLSRED